jgi:hypothetical protein
MEETGISEKHLVQVSVETEEVQSHPSVFQSQATTNEGLLVLFLILQQRPNDGVLYETFELMIWSSTHVRYTIRRVGVECTSTNCDAALMAPPVLFTGVTGAEQGQVQQ